MKVHYITQNCDKESYHQHFGEEERYVKSIFARLSILLMAILVMAAMFGQNSFAQGPENIVNIGAYNTIEQAKTIKRYYRSNDRAKDPSVDPADPSFNTLDSLKGIVNAVAADLTNIDNWQSSSDNWTTGKAGVIGLGLLMAWEMSGTNAISPTSDVAGNSYLTQAKAIGNHLKGLADPNVLLSTDIIFLYGLSNVTGDATYATAGFDGLAAFKDNFSDANAVHAFYTSDYPIKDPNDIDLKQIAHWNLASWIEAARLYADSGELATQEATVLRTWADELMAETILDQDATTGGFPYNTQNYVRTASQAKVVEVLKRFYAVEKSEALCKGLAFLQILQSDKNGTSKNGAFRWGGTIVDAKVDGWNEETIQDQSYAVQAMAYNFQTTWDNYNKFKGPYWGSCFLIQKFYNTSQTAFVEGAQPPLLDSNSEALQALYYSLKEGDVDRSGKIIAYDALQSLKGSANKATLTGPALVAALRTNWDGGQKNQHITEVDALAILNTSVGDNSDCPIRSFLGK